MVYTILTGAAGGLGSTTAHYLASNGYNLILTDIYRPKELQEELQSYDIECHAFKLDVSDPKHVQGLVDQAQEIGEINALVTFAGITRDRTIKKMTQKEWDEVIDVNLKGTFLAIQTVAKVMEEGGSIVTIGSVVAKFGNFGQANYVASKAGVEGVTKVAAREFAKNNIRVNCILPGFIKSPMTEKLPDTIMDKMIDKIPLGRIGQPEEIATAIEFLLSDKSSYLTGSSLNINGGMWMG